MDKISTKGFCLLFQQKIPITKTLESLNKPRMAIAEQQMTGIEEDHQYL